MENDIQRRSEQVTAAQFRHVCGLFPTGVTIVTRRMDDGKPYGMTVSSFTSVSLDPPLVLVSIDHSARFLRGLRLALPFVINVLGENQQHLAKTFASRQEDNRFRDVDWSADWENVPLIGGIVASFRCLLDKTVEAGDHTLLLGSVEGVEQHEGRPLVWCDRGYHCLPFVS